MMAVTPVNQVSHLLSDLEPHTSPGTSEGERRNQNPKHTWDVHELGSNVMSAVVVLDF